MALIFSKETLLAVPYVGLQPFSRDIKDQKRFFGRDYEADEIISLILGHKLSLIYAQSGAGKTSIMNAKVAPELEEFGYEVLPSARIGNFSNMKQAALPNRGVEYSPLQNKNIYMSNAIQSLLKEQNINPNSLSNIDLSDFLSCYYPLSNDKATGDSKPQILIFDQLEELFTFYPDDKWREQQRNFFEQVAKALKNNPLLHIVFIIREDYLAELDPFLEILPERLRPRFRLERLRQDSAFLADSKAVRKHEL